MEDRPIRILLVDDDEEDYIIASDVIADIPDKAFHVEWRNSYSDAVEALESGRYDLLVFDYRLGPESGIDLLGHAIAIAYPAPVIMLTGQHDREIDGEAIRMGAADYLIKGHITPDIFERSIRHAIEHHQTLTQLRASNAFLQSIIDANPAALAILNSTGAISTVNQAWETRFGVDTSRAVGANYSLWVEDSHPEELAGRQAFDAGIRAVLAEESERFSIDSPLSAGDLCQWVESSVTAFHSVDKVFAVVAYDDITSRKLAESQLQKSREKLQELSVRDELTGTFNRRHFNSVIQVELARAQRHDKTFAVLLLDIDHFKAVNDTHGHQVGDAALQHVARIARAVCRQADLLARYGGEEFVFILPETGLDGARIFAERVRQAIEAAPLALSANTSAPGLAMTASLGLAVFPAAGDSAEALLEYADKGLYLAKRQGRNRVCHAGD